MMGRHIFINKNVYKRVIMVLSILSMIAMIISGCTKSITSGGQDAAGGTGSEQITEQDQEPDVSVSQDSEKEDVPDSGCGESSGKSQEYQVDFAVQNTWGEEGNYGGTYNVTFTNQSGSEVSDWKMEAEVPNGSEVSEAWGCEVRIQGTAAVITAVDWGAKVANGQKMEVGFNMNSPSLFTPAVQSLYVSGNLVDTGDTAVSNTNSSTQTQSDTEEKEQDNADNNSSNTSDRSIENEKLKTETGTPLANHGALSVKGTDLVDKNGKVYQLKGVSTHGLAWFPDYVNRDAFQTIRDDWGGNVIRLAMYSDENGGYCSDGDKAELKRLVESGVNQATELGMYVIIDWHVLREQDPLRHKDEAKKFFDEMSGKYASYDNVLYEICNEPNGGATWSGNVRPYAEEIIPVIRANDKDAVIIVGTPNWSQDVDVVADDVISHPISDAGNVMYALHFYAATHTDFLRNKLMAARNQGLPVFISECSICDASGNGANDYNQAEKWFDLINEYQLSYCCWSLCNKEETSALISSGSSKTSGWTEQDLSETGKWIRNKMKGK